MRRVRTQTRGTAVAQPLRRMRKATAGSIRSETRSGFFDKGKFERAEPGPMALPRSAAGAERRERRYFGRRIHATRTRLAARRATRIERSLYQRRGAESDAEFQGARDGGGGFDGQRVGRAQARSAVGR